MVVLFHVRFIQATKDFIQVKFEATIIKMYILFAIVSRNNWQDYSEKAFFNNAIFEKYT
jgi:hypothetical protein